MSLAAAYVVDTGQRAEPFDGFSHDFKTANQRILQVISLLE